MDIDELMSPYGPAKLQGGSGATSEPQPEIAVEDGVVDFSSKPPELPTQDTGKHRAEVPTDSVKPTTNVVPIQIGRLSA